MPFKTIDKTINIMCVWLKWLANEIINIKQKQIEIFHLIWCQAFIILVFQMKWKKNI